MPDNFDPYFDYGKITPEMARDFRDAARIFREAEAAMISASDEDVTDLAKIVLEAQDRISAIISEIRSEIHTVPMMVHIAGQKKLEQNPDNPDEEAVIQRCTRCGSTLQFWYEGVQTMTISGPEELEEEDIPWWEEGTIVAKMSGPGGMGFYKIDKGRELEPHEMECVALPNIDVEG